MFYRPYKNTSQQISLLGFGCMRLPKLSEDKKDINFPAAEAMIDYAYAHGVNYFDTAYPYHGGMSETFIGQALKKYPRDRFYLASKMPSWMVSSMEDVERIFEEPLQKCQVDYFDFYLCHALDSDKLKTYRKLDIIGYLQRQKEAGRIRQLGFSFHDTPEVLREIIALHDWDFAQIQLNYLDWNLLQNAKGQYDVLVEHGLPCVVMEPVRGGALATLCPEGCKMLQEAEPMRSPASWAIRFAASQPNVMVVLSGMSSMEQVQDNIATMSAFAPLTEQERVLLQKVAQVYLDSKVVPCTGCRYCMECPAGVDIPLMFKLYNGYATTEDEDAFLPAYRAAGEAHQAHQCVACRQCLEKCPQHITIPEKLAQIKALAAKLDN